MNYEQKHLLKWLGFITAMLVFGTLADLPDKTKAKHRGIVMAPKVKLSEYTKAKYGYELPTITSGK